MKKTAERGVALVIAGSLALCMPVAGFLAPAVAHAETGTGAAQDPIAIRNGMYKVSASMADPTGLNMIKIDGDEAYLIAKNGKTSLRFKMGGTGIDYLYTDSNGQSAIAAGKSKWLKPVSVYEKSAKEETTGELVEKYYFTIPVTVTSAGSVTIPLCAHSKAQNRWYNGRDITFAYTANEKSVTSSLKAGKVKIKKAASKKKKTAVITWKKLSKNVTRYEVRYSLKKSFKKAETVKTKAYEEDEFGELKAVTSTTVKKLKRGKRYYVQVRAYNWISDSYGAWSAKKSVRVK